VALDLGEDSRRRDRPPLPRQAAAEVVGTFFLTLAGAGVEMVAVLYPGHIDRVMKAAAPAAVVAAMIYSIGDISGAHLNPVVTTAFAVRRAFAWRFVPVYWAAQIAGALLAGSILRALFGTVASGGSNTLHVTSDRGVIIEALVTALLIIVILNTAHKQSLIGTEAALAVGATLFASGLLAGELTTASLNPARALGPAVVADHFQNLWVFIIGPFLGGAVALGIMMILRPRTNADEADAAEGQAEHGE
jgi:aquaporin Z